MNAAIVILATAPVCIGFGASTVFIRPSVPPLISSRPKHRQAPPHHPNIRLLAKMDDDDYEGDEVDDDDEALMAAFASLDALGSLDGDEDAFPEGSESFSQSGAFDAMLNDLENDGDIATEIKAGNTGKQKSAEDEVKMYTDMLGELSDKGEEGIYDNLRLDLAKANMDLESLMDLADAATDDDDDNDEAIRRPNPPETKVEIEESQDEMIDRVMKEALEEAQGVSPEIQIDSLEGDEEMMKEINALFDRAAVEMKAAAAQIKKDQAIMSAEYSELRKEKEAEEEERLRAGKAQVSKMMEKVEKEAAEVQQAIADLEAAKAKTDGDPLLKVLNFKNAGVAKQGALTLSLLLALRSLIDLVQIGGVSGNEHAFLAAVQAVVSVAAGVFYFFF
eukprot:CAMPEP_0196820408 /NCGR_PEP_ID=MMETSP1362-20130617/75145_1 /TAXON_ID=163516 /ORGANISM="Leptocylindrus danicus, Strain CCMP1856" /LENGTH=390 /DNA_ID=CAMNT_0042199283 /DNA_START=53 /DNA_END=1225 /DNA_ORIENTATION=-